MSLGFWGPYSKLGYDSWSNSLTFGIYPSVSARGHVFMSPPSQKLSSMRYHQMETFSALLAICAKNSPVIGQWRGTLMFSLIGAWINGWVNNAEASDLRCHRAHYDVTVMTRRWSVCAGITSKQLHPMGPTRHIVLIHLPGSWYPYNTFLSIMACLTMSHESYATWERQNCVHGKWKNNTQMKKVKYSKTNM